MAAGDYSYCVEQVRRHDSDRFVTASFAPSDRRPALLALYAFNLEIARIREQAREPLLGRIRLQWWREAVADLFAGRVGRHYVLEPLSEAVARHGLSREPFDRLLDAREADMADAPPADLAALLAYAEGSSACLIALALAVLDGAPAERAAVEAARPAGIGYALVGLLRAVPFHARGRRLYLPQEMTESAGLRISDPSTLRPSPALSAVVGDVAAEAGRQLTLAQTLSRGLPRRLLPALLPVRLARGYLGGLARAGFDPFDVRVQRPAAGRLWWLMTSMAMGRL